MTDRISAFAMRLLLSAGIIPYRPPRRGGENTTQYRSESVSPPLPPRKRALTLYDDAFLLTTSNSTIFRHGGAETATATTSVTLRGDPQSSSPLFHIARELREEIYVYVLGGRNIHLGLEKHDFSRLTPYLRHYYCKTDSSVTRMPYHECWSPMGGRKKDPVETMLAFLMTCRRIYSEAIPVLYNANMFHLISLFTFVALPTLILPTRLTSLRTLVLQISLAEFPPQADTQEYLDFNSLWTILDINMTGLREVQVHISTRHAPEREQEKDWVERRYKQWLGQVDGLRRRLKVFRVFLPLRNPVLEMMEQENEGRAVCESEWTFAQSVRDQVVEPE